MKKKHKKDMKKGGTALCLCALLALGGCTKTADSGTVQMSQTVEENTQPMTETPEAETETESESASDVQTSQTGETGNAGEAVVTKGYNAGMVKVDDNIAMFYPYSNAEDLRNECDFVNDFTHPELSEEYKIQGNVSSMMMCGEDVYFGMNDSLYHYNFSEGKEEAVLSDVPYAQMLGSIEGKVYFSYAGPELDMMMTHMAEYDPATGRQRELQGEELAGNVDALVGGGHLFYIGGRTDVSARGLYEMNIETGTSEKIDEYAVGMVYDEMENLYYTACDSQDFMSNPVTLKKYDTQTGEISELFTDSMENMGTILRANGDGIFFQTGIQGDSSYALMCWDPETETMTEAAGGANIRYVPDCKNNHFYYIVGRKNDDGYIVSSELYRYSGGGSALIANGVESEIVGATWDTNFQCIYGTDQLGRSATRHIVQENQVVR